MSFKVIADTFSVSRDSDHFIQLKTIKKPSSDEVAWLAIEIIGESRYAKSTTQKIIETIEDVFFTKDTEGAYERFENTLKEINLLINHLQDKKGAKGIGEISAMIAVLSGNELHFTQSKNAEAYLLRKGKFNMISEGLSGRSKDTFVNIASGELLPNDKLVFSTTRLLRLAANSQLAQIFGEGVTEALDSIRELVMAEEDVNIGVICINTKIPQVATGERMEKIRQMPIIAKLKSMFGGAANKMSEKVGGSQLGSKLGGLNKLNKNSILIAIGVVALLLVLSVSVLIDSSRNKQLREEYRVRIEALQQDLLSAQTKGYANDKETANAILDKVEKESREIIDTNFFRAEVLALLDKAQETRDSINNTDRFKDLAPYVDLSTKKEGVEALEFVNLGGNFFVNEFNTMFEVILNQVLSPKTIDGSEVVIASAPVEDQDLIVMLTQSGRVIEYNEGQFQFANTEDEAWKSGVDIAAYGRNIYVLSPANNQIYKYPRLRSNYAGASEWNLDADLNGAISLAIDGNIYVLKKGGEIIKLYKSNQEPFVIEDLAADLSDVTRIFTTIELDHIYLLDPTNNKVIVLEKTLGGNAIYRAQYVFEDLSEIQDIYVNKTEDKLYVLTKKEIYQVDI